MKFAREQFFSVTLAFVVAQFLTSSDASAAGGLLKVDPGTGNQTFLASGGFLDGPMYALPTGPNEVLVANFGAGNLVSVDLSTGLQTVAYTSPLFNGPKHLSVMPDGSLLVSNWSGSNFLRVDTVTGAVTVFSSASSQKPSASVVTPSGEIYGLTNAGGPYGDGAVWLIDPVTGNRTLVSGGDDGTMRRPDGMVLEAAGDLLVTSRFSGTTPGALFRIDVNSGAQTLLSLGNELGLPVNFDIGANGDAWIAEWGNAAVVKIDSVSGAQTLISNGGFFANPAGITFDDGNTLIVTDFNAVAPAGYVAADAGPDQTVEAGATVQLDGRRSFNETNYQWSQIAGPAVTLSSTSAAQPTFMAPSVTGDTTLTFELVVDDGAGNASDPDTVDITVTAAPLDADAGPDQSVDEGDIVTLDGTGSIGATNYSWIQTAGTTVTLDDPTSPTPNFTAPFGDGDTLEFELTVDDGAGRNDTDTVTVTVADVIDADAGPDQTVDEGDFVMLDGTGSTGAVNYFWLQVGGGTTVTLDNDSSATPSFTAPYGNGDTLTFQLTVDDGAGKGDMDTVDITVVDINQPPVADATGPATVKVGAQGTLSGLGSFDPESDTISYNWAQTGGPAAPLDDPSAAEPTFIAPAPPGSVLEFELVVDDGKEFSAPDTVTVTVVDNSPPDADAGPDQTADEGSLVTLDGTGSSDPDGDGFSYAWMQTAGSPVVLDNPSAAQPSFNAPDVGAAGESLTFELTVTDDDAVNPQSDTDDMIVNVLDVNAPPNCGLAQTVCFDSSSEKSDKSNKSNKSKKSGKSGKSKSGKRVKRECTVLRRHNHKLVKVAIEGVSDPESETVSVLVTGVTQDEPTSGMRGKDVSPDAVLQGDESVLIRRERDKDGNGRVYEINFTATDASGASCDGSLNLSVPLKKKDPAIDDGQTYDSTQP